MLTGSPSPGGGGGETGTDPAKPTGGGVTPGNPDSPGRTLSFTLELGSGPSRTLITSDKGTPVIGTVSGKTYPLTVTQVPPTAAALTLTVKKTGFLDTTIGPIPISPAGNPPPQTKTIPYAYTTTITGTVTTPARAADPAKGTVIKTAQVWASTNPENKVTVDTADGSCKTGAPRTVRVVMVHPGTARRLPLPSKIVS